MNGLERKMVIHPAWDKRSTDPKKDYGQHCVDMTWFVIGPEGAVQFKLFTGWYPDVIQKTKSWDDWGDWTTLHVKRHMRDTDAPMPADLGYHSVKPKYEGQTPMECTLLPGGSCYYDGSGLNANKAFSILVHEGGEKLWEFLEGYYRETFAEEEVAA